MFAKNIKLVFTSLLLVGAGGAVWYASNMTPCDSPLKYSIGQFDTQFGVSESQFLQKVYSAETVWEKSLGKELFVYDKEAKFKINLIYDQRQKDIDAKQKTEFGLSSAETVFKKLDVSFNSLNAEYERRVDSHNNLADALKIDQESYERDVAYQNAHGGAKPAQYNELESRRQSLNARVDSLNQDAVSIKVLSAQLSSLLKERNTSAENYNKIARGYNAKYGQGLEFDQAEYVSDREGQRINVYEFSGVKDLTIALAHELGHALGMDHVENSKSIMFYMTGDQILNPTAEDVAELKRVCGI